MREAARAPERRDREQADRRQSEAQEEEPPRGAQEDRAMPTTEDAWNGWRLNGLVLEYQAYPATWYSLDLYDVITSAVMLDKIMQVSRKLWATDACVAGLVRALNDILQPQANLCSGGTNKTMPREKIAARVAGFAEGGP
jgi:hypothetical protein